MGRAYHADKGIGVEPEYFADYQLLHRTINEFAPGYVAMKINYVLKSYAENAPETSNSSSNATEANKTTATSHDVCNTETNNNDATNATY